MARKPHTPAEPTAATGPAPDAHALTRADEAEIVATEAEMAFEAAESIGITKMALFTRSVADKVIVETFLKLRKNKAYRALTIRGDDGKPRRVADLEEFCERYLGRSARRVQELAQQYQMLGGELFEAAERIGFRNQDYRALKALPEDDQAVIKQAIEAEDRDTVLSLMQELAAKHQAEKAALQAEAAEAQETAEARDQVVKAKEAKITRLEEANNKLKRRVAKATPDEVGAQLREETGQFAYAAEAEILGNLRAGFAALADHAAEHDVTHDDFMSGCLAQIEAAIGQLREDYNVKARPDGDRTPDWMRDTRSGEELLQDELGGEIAEFEARMAAAGKNVSVLGKKANP